jgi:hypothetical protein
VEAEAITPPSLHFPGDQELLVNSTDNFIGKEAGTRIFI